MLAKLRNLIRLPAADKVALLEAIVLSAWARFLIRQPFDRLAPRLGEHGKESSGQDTGTQLLLKIRRVQRATRMAARNLPWDCRCFVKAIVARTMLDRRSVDGTLYLGVRPGGKRGIEAHAWVRCGPMIVVGLSEYESYAIVSAFAFGPEDLRPRNAWVPQSRPNQNPSTQLSPERQAASLRDLK